MEAFAGAADFPLAIQSLPSVLPDEGFEIELGVAAVVDGAPAGGTFSLTWPTVDVPEGWALTLRDADTGAEVDLRTATEYGFAAGEDLGDRFTLHIAPASAVAVDSGPGALGAAVVVGPNPASSRVTVRYHMSAPGPASVTVLDLLGREVARLTDGPHAAGWHTVGLATERLAPGTYVVRLSGASGPATARLTVVR